MPNFQGFVLPRGFFARCRRAGVILFRARAAPSAWGDLNFIVSGVTGVDLPSFVCALITGDFRQRVLCKQNWLLPFNAAYFLRK